MRPDLLPPSNLEAERLVLGSALTSEQAAWTAMEELRPADFYSEHHRAIFTALTALLGAGRPVTVAAVEDVLRGTKVDGLMLLDLCSASVPSQAVFHARILRENGVRRRLADGAAQLRHLAHEGDYDAMLDAAQVILETGSGTRADAAHISDGLEAMERRIRDDQGQRGVASGFRRLDRLTGGLLPGSLILLAARPGVGKTSLALAIALHVARQGTVGFVSLEMDLEDLTERALAMMSGVPLGRSPSLAQFESQAKAAAQLMELPIMVASGRTVPEVRALGRKLKRTDLALLVVDYLQLLRAPRRAENRQQEVAEISRELKMLAQDLEVPVLAASQLNRDSERREDRRPTLSDLRDSGTLEQDSDVVMFIYRPAPGVAQLLVRKNRRGAEGEIPLRWTPELTLFVEGP